MKYLFSLLLSVCIYSFSFSQDSKFEIGIQAGNSLVSMRHTGYSQYPYRFKSAFSAGLFVQYNINKYFSLRVEPGYEKKGYDTSYDSTFIENGNPIKILQEFPITANFNYITIPVLARASIGKKVKYFINAGPYVGFLMSQNIIYNYGVVNYDKYKYNTAHNYKTLDFGITTGLGMYIPMKNIFALSFEIRNNLGLMNISNPTYNSDINKTLAFNLLLGFSYRIGAKIPKKEQEIIYIK
jgi:hypothetical protein